MSTATVNFDVRITSLTARKAAVDYIVSKIPSGYDPSLREIRGIATCADREQLIQLISEKIRLEGVSWSLEESLDFGSMPRTARYFVDATVDGMLKKLFPELTDSYQRENRYVFGKSLAS